MGVQHQRCLLRVCSHVPSRVSTNRRWCRTTAQSRCVPIDAGPSVPSVANANHPVRVTCPPPSCLPQWLWVAKSEDLPEYKGMDAAISEGTQFCEQACLSRTGGVVTDSGVPESVSEVTERVEKIQVRHRWAFVCSRMRVLIPHDDRMTAQFPCVRIRKRGSRARRRCARRCA